MAPDHLTGEYLGDRGFDPLGFGKDPKALQRNRIAEVFHGRLAMLAFAGALVPELQGKASWSETFTRAADPAVLGTFVFALIVALAPLELWRYNGAFPGDKKSDDSNYPGFDPFGLASEETKLKEIKNGRLAMIAVLGFAVQAATTGASPLQNFAAVTPTAMFAASGAFQLPSSQSVFLATICCVERTSKVPQTALHVHFFVANCIWAPHTQRTKESQTSLQGTFLLLRRAKLERS